MKKIIPSIFVLMFSFPVFAGPNSVLGGTRLDSDTAHYVGVGWPSLTYEWWHRGGNMDWAIGGEVVYGDWSGEFSNVEIGFALNVPMKWHIYENGRVNVGFKFAPGGLIGDVNAPGNDLFAGAIRFETGLPITIEVNDKVNIITGAVIPFTVMFVENADPFVIIPIMPRIGVEFSTGHRIDPFLLLELGPTIAAGDFGSEVELGIRASVGALFW